MESFNELEKFIKQQKNKQDAKSKLAITQTKDYDLIQQLIKSLVKDPEPPMLYTVKEVAKILMTNIDYVHSLRRAGLLKFIKLGQYKIRRQTLIKFLEDFDGYDLTNPLNIKEMK